MLIQGRMPAHPDAVINPNSLCSIGWEMINSRTAQQAATNAWPTAAMAIFIPFWIGQSVTVTEIGWVNGTPVASSVDAGIYRPDGTKVITTGVTAASGANAIQKVNIADTLLSPGNYYMACMGVLTTVQLFRWAPLAPLPMAMGVRTMAAANPLPNTATFALNQTLTYVPHMFLQTRSVA